MLTDWLAWLRGRGISRKGEIPSAAEGGTPPSLQPATETAGPEADAAEVGPCAVPGVSDVSNCNPHKRFSAVGALKEEMEKLQNTIQW